MATLVRRYVIPFWREVLENLARKCIVWSARREPDVRSETLLSCALYCLGTVRNYRFYLEGSGSPEAVLMTLKYASNDLGVAMHGIPGYGVYGGLCDGRFGDRKEVMKNDPR